MAGAGYRRSPKKFFITTFKNAKNKVMWAITGGGTIFYTKGIEEHKDEDGNIYKIDQEFGPEIRIYLPMFSANTENQATYVLDLTAMTHSEYLNLRKIFAIAFKEAESIIKVRDAHAEHRLNSGEVAPSRAYRPVSRLFTPKGEVK